MSGEAVQNLLFVICGALVAGTVGVAHLAGMLPRSARERTYVIVTLTFITWLLAGFAFLRSR